MDVFDLVAKITLDSSSYDSALGKAGNAFSSFGSALKAGGAAVTGIAGSAIKMTGRLAEGVAIAATAAGSAAVALTKSAVSSYAEYEQLIGGVETLFGESSGIVEAYADNAFKTAGLSANEYMATVTGFSASLLQSLGGDTDAAARYADMAVTDMSDNYNKLGTDMSLVQNAYQGFAKQNFTINLMSAA